MFNPSTYNINNSAGSVNMSFSFEGTAYDPNFTWTGDIDISNAIHSVSYTIEDYLTPDTGQREAFINELYTYGLPRIDAETLIDSGEIIPSSQEEAESLMEVLTNIASDGDLEYGTVGVPSVTATGTLTVTYGANTSGNSLTSTINGRVDVPDSDTITFSGTIIQSSAAVAGSITITPSTVTVYGSTTTRTFTVTTSNMDLSTLTYSTGGDISFSSVAYNANKTEITATFPENTGSANKVGTLTVSGTDLTGTTRTSTTTITQQVKPSITYGTHSATVQYISTSYLANFTMVNCSNPTVTYSGTVDITSATVGSVDGNYMVRLAYTANESTTIRVSNIVLSATGNDGLTYTDTFELTQTINASPGSITLDPSSVSVAKTSGSTTATVTTARIVSALTVTHSGEGGTDTVTSASISGSTLMVNYRANISPNPVTDYVTVSGIDVNGNTQSATLTINQAGNTPSASITITPSTKTVSRTDYYTTFTITTSGTVNNLSMTTTAYWITDYQINNGTLSLTFSANSGSQRTATLTVLGTDSGGNKVSATATLTQEGATQTGTITVDPTSRTLNATETTCMYVVTTENIASALTVTKSGNVVTTDYHLSEEDFGYYLWVTTADNTGTTDLTSTFTISGTDTGGTTRTATATLIKKAPVAGSITIEPTQKTVGYKAGSTTFTVTARNIVGNLTLELNTTSTMNITSYTLNNGTLTVVYGANSGAQKNGAINIRGTDVNGVQLVEIARLYQNQAPATYTFAFNPASQSARTVAVSPTSLRYTIDSWKTVGSQYELSYSISEIEYTGGSWPTVINIRYEDGKPYILIPMNMTGNQRTAVVHFLQEESNREITSTVTQEGRGSSTENFLPIWRDDIHTASADSFIEYHISLGADIIYAGKAYKYPDASTIEWTINDVCSNYIGTGITFTSGIQRITDYCKVFSTVTNDQTLVNTRFYNSWAYDDTDYWLSDPIDYRVDPRQWLPVSFLSSNSRNIRVGSTSYTASASNDGWTVMTNLNNLTLDCGSAFTVTPGIGQARNYKIDCGDFVLYYANAYGGWDALLVKGTTKKTDNIEHLNYRRKSRDLSDFSKVNYQNNITPTWSLNTGITVNGKKMYHLLESVMVYLHNLETNEIIPVVITNAQCEYLDYTNNGKKPYYYNITVEESNLKLRK